MSNENLLEDTIEQIYYHGKSPEDVLLVGLNGYDISCNWAEFSQIADIQYDSGYGGAEIAESLVVVFSDNSWLERYEYDGSEWWTYKKAPSFNGKQRKLTKELLDEDNFSVLRRTKARGEVDQ